ncbi:DUF2156 domain-containing protein [Thermodesulfobacteriota bacterium]
MVQSIDNFKPVEIGDKEIFNRFFRQDPPRVSELTFTNLFIWRHRYRPIWTRHGDFLFIILEPHEASFFGLPPVGTGDKRKAIDLLCDELNKMTPEPRICRLSEEIVEKYVDENQYTVLPDRDNSDYVYAASDLINLSGRKYHKKKNHLNRFSKNYAFEYREMDVELVECFLDMQEEWCQMKECLEDPGLHSEDYAIHTAMTHFEELDFKGGAIQIDSRIEAFSLGETLNDDTAVIHIEKANPDIPGLYTVINHRFCSNAFSDMMYINREQDLGIEGLRKAKESYYPHHMVHKYTIFPK